ncbi:hypothetical protein JCM10295v2_003039 [Rhodotorula toruloides]
MASTTYSATPQPPQRIRVVTHPPLAPLRAWLPLPQGGGPGTVADLLASVQGLVRDDRAFEAELQGFALLPDSPLSLLDPINDVLEIKLASDQPHLPAQAARDLASASRVPLPQSPSRQPSLSSSSATSSDDDKPEVLPAKRPVTHGETAIPNGRPTKRRRTSVSSSSSSSSSSDSDSDSSLPSDSSSSSSSSSSDSDSSSPNSQLHDSTTKVAATGLVPPGQGKHQTKKRNERKRKLRLAKAQEKARDVGADGLVGVAASATSVAPKASPKKAAIVEHASSATPEPTRSKPSLDPYAGFQPAPSASKPTHRSSPISSVSTGANQAFPVSVQHGTNEYYDSPQPAHPGARAPLPPPREMRSKSPEYRPTSPNVTFSTRPAHQSTDASPAPAASSTAPCAVPTSQPELPLATPKPSFIPPSKRPDLPPHVVVTKVDVEAKKWQPGVGRVIKGTSRDWVPVKAKEMDEVATGGAGEWKGWVEVEEVQRRWDGLRKVDRTQVQPGMRVATQIFELDRTTFQPTVSLKYGRLLPSSPDDSSTLRVQLHPSCLLRPIDADEPYDGADAAEDGGDEALYDEWAPKPKFGQDSLDLSPQEDAADPSVWEGEWDGADVRVVV